MPCAQKPFPDGSGMFKFLKSQRKRLYTGYAITVMCMFQRSLSLMHNASAAVDEVDVFGGHAAVVEEADGLLHHNGHLERKRKHHKKNVFGRRPCGFWTSGSLYRVLKPEILFNFIITFSFRPNS